QCAERRWGSLDSCAIDGCEDRHAALGAELPAPRQRYFRGGRRSGVPGGGRAESEVSAGRSATTSFGGHKQPARTRFLSSGAGAERLLRPEEPGRTDRAIARGRRGGSAIRRGL